MFYHNWSTSIQAYTILPEQTVTYHWNKPAEQVKQTQELPLKAVWSHLLPMGTESVFCQLNRLVSEIASKQGNKGTYELPSCCWASWSTPPLAAGFSHRFSRSQYYKQIPVTACASLLLGPVLVLLDFILWDWDSWVCSSPADLGSHLLSSSTSLVSL